MAPWGDPGSPGGCHDDVGPWGRLVAYGVGLGVVANRGSLGPDLGIDQVTWVHLVVVWVPVGLGWVRWWPWMDLGAGEAWVASVVVPDGPGAGEAWVASVVVPDGPGAGEALDGLGGRPGWTWCW